MPLAAESLTSKADWNALIFGASFWHGLFISAIECISFVWNIFLEFEWVNELGFNFPPTTRYWNLKKNNSFCSNTCVKMTHPFFHDFFWFQWPFSWRIGLRLYAFLPIFFVSKTQKRPLSGALMVALFKSTLLVLYMSRYLQRYFFYPYYKWCPRYKATKLQIAIMISHIYVPSHRNRAIAEYLK